MRKVEIAGMEGKVTDCSKRLAGKEKEVWWRWAKRLWNGLGVSG